MPQQVDYRLVSSAIARVHWELNVTCGQERNPGFYVDQTLGLLFLSLLTPPPFGEARSRRIVHYLKSFRGTVANAKENLAGKAIKPFALAALEKLVAVRSRLTKVGTELGPFLSGVDPSEFNQSVSDAITALERYHDWLTAELSRMTEETAVGREAYIYFLKHVALMPFTPEQLLVIGKHEWERSVAFESLEQTRNGGVTGTRLVSRSSDTDGAGRILGRRGAAFSRSEEHSHRPFMDEALSQSAAAAVRRAAVLHGCH